jgi:hypothetical protein
MTTSDIAEIRTLFIGEFVSGLAATPFTALAGLDDSLSSYLADPELAGEWGLTCEEVLHGVSAVIAEVTEKLSRQGCA